MSNMTELSRRIRKIYLLRRGLFGKLAADLEVDMQQNPILQYVKANPQCTQVELAKALAVSPASIASSIKRMQKTGLIQKEVNEKDLRQNRLSITQKGLETSEQCKAIAQSLNHKMFDGFSEQKAIWSGSFTICPATKTRRIFLYFRSLRWKTSLV